MYISWLQSLRDNDALPHALIAGGTGGGKTYFLLTLIEALLLSLIHIFATLTTDENGNTDIAEVKAGTVYIKELSAPAGYKVDKLSLIHIY